MHCLFWKALTVGFLSLAQLLPSSAQAPAQLSWAELALISFPPAPTRPAGRPPGRLAAHPSRLVVKQLENSNTRLVIALGLVHEVVGNQIGRRPQHFT